MHVFGLSREPTESSNLFTVFVKTIFSAEEIFVLNLISNFFSELSHILTSVTNDWNFLLYKGTCSSMGAVSPMGRYVALSLTL